MEPRVLIEFESKNGICNYNVVFLDDCMIMDVVFLISFLKFFSNPPPPHSSLFLVL